MTDQPEILSIDDITAEQKKLIVEAASKFVVCSTLSEPLTKEIVETLGDFGRQMVEGVFVTLRRDEQLRGCCGMIGKPVPLVDALYQSAKRTAKDDRRFPPVARVELAHLSLDVSILGAPKKLEGGPDSYPEQIKIGRDGLRILMNQKAGLLLPSVAEDNEMDSEEFLDAVCKKAGLPSGAWKDPEAVVERFEGILIDDSEVSDSVLAQHTANKSLEDNAILSVEQIMQYRSVVAQNISALMQGGTPSYYVPQLPDVTVNGLVLSLIDADRKHTLAHLIRVSLRPGMPLQTSLFEQCKTATTILQKAKLSSNLKLELALTILHDPALHGQIVLPKSPEVKPGGEHSKDPIDGCSLTGVDAGKRAIVPMMSGDRVSVCFEANQTPEQLVRRGVQSLSAHGRPTAIYSMQYLSTRPYLTATSAPAPQAGPGSRAPAFSGAFYEGTDTARQEQVAGLMLGAEAEKEDALAIMTPHAGLKYSGRVAADVWRRVNMPETVLIIGPKHTPKGVDWAVAPYRRWQLSSKVSIESDQTLAKAIASGVSGMQLDAAAHSREHGTEVQLPFIEALAPKTKIASVVMHAGTWPEIKEAAKQLAEVLTNQPKMPLLVISSDMNHYSPVVENKRRDKMARQAMKNGDPEGLLKTCIENQISMCGVLQAALVMQTLNEMNKPFQCKEVSYATSADYGGDPKRVVGYSSMILV